MSDPLIRPATSAEAALLPEIEVSAATLFRAAGVEIFSGESADDPIDVTPAEVWGPIIAEGLVWVAETEGRLDAFLAARREPDSLHILEFDVRRDRQGRGLGRRLLSHAIAQARSMDLGGLSLTTFRDVAWNAPFYASAGFAVVERDAAPLWLAAYLDLEARRGLDPARRCAMVLRFQSGDTMGSVRAPHPSPP